MSGTVRRNGLIAFNMITTAAAPAAAPVRRNGPIGFSMAGAAPSSPPPPSSPPQVPTAPPARNGPIGFSLSSRGFPPAANRFKHNRRNGYTTARPTAVRAPAFSPAAPPPQGPVGLAIMEAMGSTAPSFYHTSPPGSAPTSPHQPFLAYHDGLQYLVVYDPMDWCTTAWYLTDWMDMNSDYEGFGTLGSCDPGVHQPCNVEAAMGQYHGYHQEQGYQCQNWEDEDEGEIF